MPKAYFVYITTASTDEAEKIGAALVEERLAACVNIMPGMKSIYWWEGAMESSHETVLIAKTTEERIAALTDKVVEMHSYSCPCVVAMPIERGYEPYLVWIHNSVR